MKKIVLASALLCAAYPAFAEDLSTTVAQAEIQIGQLEVALGQAHLQIIDLQKKLADADAKAKLGEKSPAAAATAPSK